MTITELKTEWLKMSYQEKKKFVEVNDVRPCERVSRDRPSGPWSPCHPITRQPSNETFQTWQGAAIEQIDWLVHSI
jgi:hypothetical protein